MRVIVDTSAWSLALRRQAPPPDVSQQILQLVRQDRVQMLGVIRQELLSGIRSPDRFRALRTELAKYPDLVVTTDDHEEAAAAFNVCRARGVQGNVVDMLICALAMRHTLGIFALDKDFQAYSRCIPIKLHEPS